MYELALTVPIVPNCWHLYDLDIPVIRYLVDLVPPETRFALALIMSGLLILGGAGWLFLALWDLVSVKKHALHAPAAERPEAKMHAHGGNPDGK